MDGISATNDEFALRCWGAVLGSRRRLDGDAVAMLTAFAQRYRQVSNLQSNAAELLTLGRDLYRWLDGGERQLEKLLHATRPLRLEIGVSRRHPSPAEWALLHAPWELLADAQGHLAGDARLGFCPVRRLGRAEPPPPLDQYRLGLMFMAASPRGAAEIDYEAEEVAIIDAVRTANVDLRVEESGNLAELGKRMAEYPAMQALHLSCPGSAVRRTLLLEDQGGDPLPADAAALVRELSDHRPRLVLLAVSGEGLRKGVTRVLPEDHAPELPPDSLPVAAALIESGFPAILVCDGPIADPAAFAFAAVLYDRLSARADLAYAVAQARCRLLDEPDESRRRGWHVARLWMGPKGGGPIVGGDKRRSMSTADHDNNEFLDKRHSVPVVPREAFVGRRRVLQTALRALRERDYAGVLLHGMGGLGKSSLAAQIANRRPDLRPAVVFDKYGALDVLTALTEALHSVAAARELLRGAEERVRQDARHLEHVLSDLARGPCKSADGGMPFLLVIDDLERILEADPSGGQYRVDAAHLPVLRAILRALDPAQTDSRLLVTSRFSVALDGLEKKLFRLQLAPFSHAEQRKLERRQIESAIDAGLTGSDLEERAALLPEVLRIAGGNPGLQDLIGRKTVLSLAVPPGDAKQALRQMDDWLENSSLPSDRTIRSFLQNLATDSLINLAGASGRELLRGLMFLVLPVPKRVAETLAALHGSSLQHGCDLGLIDTSADLVDHHEKAFTVNALAAAHLDPLSEREQTHIVRAVAKPLFAAWGGAEPILPRPAICDAHLARLGLMAEDGEIVAACATNCLRSLRTIGLAEAASFGQSAIRLLDAQQRTVPWQLLSETAQVLAGAGDDTTADMLLERAIAAIEQQRSTGQPLNPRDAGFVAHMQANRLIRRGEFLPAEKLLEETAQLAAAAGDERGVAEARGRTADILQDRGELDQALRIHREEELPICDRLGDVRMRALTMGKIADILMQRGELDKALDILRDEVLPVYYRTGDVSARAVVLGRIADICYARGDLDEALRIRRDEQLPVYERLGDVRSRALAMGKIADILTQRGELDEALRIHREEQLPVYAQLGDAWSRAHTMGRIADILTQRGDLDEALRIRHEEQLPVYERLGDVRSRAVTMGRIADICYARSDLDQALHILRDEVLPVYRRMGNEHSTALVMGRIADIFYARGDLDEALRIHREEQLPVYAALDDVHSRALTMGQIADILERRGDFEEALRIREEQLSAYDRLKDVRARAAVTANIAHILALKGDPHSARGRYEESLASMRRIDDADGTSAALWGLAQLDLADGSVKDAIPRVAEAYDTMRRLDRADGIAVVGLLLGQVLAAAGQPAESRTVLDRSLELFKKLGRAAEAKHVAELIDQLAKQPQTQSS